MEQERQVKIQLDVRDGGRTFWDMPEGESFVFNDEDGKWIATITIVKIPEIVRPWRYLRTKFGWKKVFW